MEENDKKVLTYMEYYGNILITKGGMVNMKKRNFEDLYGIEACKESIRFKVEYFKQSLEEQLKEYEERAKTDITFNKTMIDACKELMKENK